ncbi:hypothetical protein WA158_001474 [Blastocystis sp. Blastoise]
MTEEATVLFKIYYEDEGKVKKLMAKVKDITTNGIKWENGEKTKDENGESCVYIRSKLPLAKNAKEVVKEIKIMPNVLDCKAKEICIVQPGFGNMNNIEMANDAPILDAEYHDDIMAYLDILKQKITTLGTYLTKASTSDIRGRLSARISECPVVGKPVRLVGKIRFNEKDYSLQGNTTCAWYISRSNQPWVCVSETYEYIPLAEDAGCKVMVVVYFKGEPYLYDGSFVHIPRQMDEEKGKTLCFPVTTTTEFTEVELKKVGKRSGDDVELRSRRLTFRRGRRVVCQAELGATGYAKTVREANPINCKVMLKDKEILVTFRAAEECARFVLLARAYTAYDRLKMILSLPKLPPLPQYNEVSYISPLIQGGFSTMPYLWDTVPDLSATLPPVPAKAIKTANSMFSDLHEAHRLVPADYSVLASMLIPALQGKEGITLPTTDLYDEAPLEEPEEPVEEEERDIVFDPDVIINPDGTTTIIPAGQPIPAGAKMASAPSASIEMVKPAATKKTLSDLAAEAPEGPFKLTKEGCDKLIEMFNKINNGQPITQDVANITFDKAGLEPEVRDIIVKMVIGSNTSISVGEYVAIIQIIKCVRKGTDMPKKVPAELQPLLPSASATSPPPPPKSNKPDLEDTTTNEPVDWTIEKSYMNKMANSFKKASGDKKELSSPLSMKAFKKTGVELENINKIISLVCGKKPAVFTEQPFCIIMGMLAKISEGAAVPEELPKEIKKMMGQEVEEEEEKEEEEEEKEENASDEWSIDTSMMNKLRTLYKTKKGDAEKMTPDVAMKFFKKSEVEVPTVQKIWIFIIIFILYSYKCF